ncbi:hypothetical protein EUX98_g6465 [Antrodiella citrinella]|uniref:Uncharacterized protein n=1 Tax=Antrodiella citrinella TaxID=2447956 RepID=A0A4S4MP20_9APHY|nr:hypothetical protein EUX98_g6465 [Antrodiella citrinella]
MSISVDDLVASLNSNHIGQEAIDLATLQAQLAKTLYTSYTTPHASQRAYPPSNTPTSRTPSSSMGWERSDGPRARSSSVVSLKRRGSLMEDRVSEREVYLEETDEDERMVEDLICPSSPITSHISPSHPYPSYPLQSSAAANSPDGSRYGSSSSSHNMLGTQMEYSPSTTSTFATTDPFFLAQLQAAQRSSAPSFFANAGRPSAQSPFALAEQGPAAGTHAFAHRIPVSEAEPLHLFAW